MATVWFLLAVLFFILWLSKKGGEKSGEEYGRGYWDGYRAFGDKVQNKLDTNTATPKQLKKIIAEGYPKQIQESTEVEPDGRSSPIFNEAATAIKPREHIELTPAQREQKTIRNLNTILYVASFLLVAAAAVFVATSMSAEIRLLGVWTVVVLFYTAGLILYHLIKRLQPAALAFLGTGLAILPFAGFAFYLLGGVSVEMAWLFTSVLGVIAYFVAAVVVKSQFVSYLTMAFVLSLGLSSVAIIGAPIVWYFILLISISLLGATLSYIKPTWVPRLFNQPVEATGQFVTPLALVASVVVGEHMSILTYELVFAVATTHYLVVWLQQRSLLYETVVRVVAHVLLLLIGFDFVNEQLSEFAGVWLAVAGMQAAYSLSRLEPQSTASRQVELVWLGVLQGLIACGSVLWAATHSAALGTLLSFVAIGIISVLLTARLRRIVWAIPALVVSLVAPFIVGRWLAQPVWEWHIIAWIFIIGLLSVVILQYLVRLRQGSRTKLFLQTAFWLYLVTSLLTVLCQMSSLATGWVAIAVALLALLFSYATRQRLIEIAAGVSFILATASWLADSVFSGLWYVTATVLISAGVLYGGAAIHQVLGDSARRNILLSLAHVVLAGILFTIGSEAAVATTNILLLLGAAITSFLLRVVVREKSIVLQQLFTVSFVVYLMIAWLVSFNLDLAWVALVYSTATVLLWAASYVVRVPWLVVAGNVTLVALIATLWQWLKFDSQWIILGTAWISGAIIYALFWALNRLTDAWRRFACLVFLWVVLGGAVLLQFSVSDMSQKISATVMLIAIAGTVVIEGYLQRKQSIIEVGVYIGTLGLQRIVNLAVPELDMIVYAHWWAAVIGIVAWWRRTDENFILRLILATALITFGTGTKALEEGGGYQLLFLVEHLVLLVIGAIKQVAWALWWGVAAVVAAILYFLKDYPYVALAFLGLVLIAIVIWRLVRQGNKPDGTKSV